MLRRTFLAATAATLSTPAFAQAPAFPNKPVRIVVPLAPGGAADVLARLVADGLGTLWRQPVVVENRPGAGGNIGAEAVARSAGDGYTLLLGTLGIHGASAIYPRLTYDPAKELAPVTVLGDLPNVIVVRPGLEARNLQDLVALARQRPGQLTFGSAGAGSSTHLAGELFMLTAGIQMSHVPYRGSAPALNDLVAGNIDAMFENLPTIPPLVAAGSLRPLAVTSATRSPALPDVPTVEEAGVPGYVATAWLALSAPATVPEPLLEQLNADTRTVLASPVTRARLDKLGITAVGGSVAASRSFFASETEKWNRVIQAAKIRLD
ncbi:Bug family tripartite tricarboxylate transporter substrate binding protein [Teichococcus oryzae]|uniref:Tripartite tricarboxylate transporter substrate binding protein n=1 Tax=Teichococcus oryzae TaxID=1608942 RepID=A0A5B2TCW0_9PROT|nr:tripartite tricarboxylate transporter substrate binding protein [Pseudoroseomonas oryzae]KAA2211620.1 tripartite tricarboxylate transporter substrate binding protein [Pseudoroseomonas oryzae]